jgi:hypothetical protein
MGFDFALRNGVYLESLLFQSLGNSILYVFHRMQIHRDLLGLDSHKYSRATFLVKDLSSGLVTHFAQLLIVAVSI